MKDLPAWFQLDYPHELANHRLLRDHHVRGDRYLMYLDLKGAVTPAALPERARDHRTVEMSATIEVVAEVDGVTVLLHCSKAGGHVWGSGEHRAQVLAVLEEIAARCPRELLPHRVDVTFLDQYNSRSVGVHARPWDDIAALYPTKVEAALRDLMGHVSSPDESRRLMLWHGAPGTGKTTAIRALMLAWRGWADSVVVTDPEVLLGDPRYLRRAVLDADDESDEQRWQLLVLEDAETLLHKGSGSKGMAKLLNLGDGLLGQGLRCLFLITTNEPLTAVHPALVRPGRCLSRFEFAALPASQAGRLVGRPVQGDMTLAEVMAAKPVTVVQEPIAVGQYL